MWMQRTRHWASCVRHHVFRLTFPADWDSLHRGDSLSILQQQGAGVVPGGVGGDGLLQGCGYAAGDAPQGELTTLILVLPGDLLDLGSLRVQT